jgi:hypothetical protein
MHNAEHMQIEAADDLFAPPVTVCELAGSNGVRAWREST